LIESSNNDMGISLLMSVYARTRADEFSRCLDSIQQQSVVPDELVLVLDGPVSAEVRACAETHGRRLAIKTVEYPDNRGLGPALREGLKHCSHSFVARMDSDDICRRHRLEAQKKFLVERPDISIVGGLLREFYLVNGETVSVERVLPEASDDVATFAKFRNPANHPTVMFRKQHVLAVGNYISFPLMEDYHLFSRMLARGFAIANLQDIFVETSPTKDFFRRRGGLRYLSQEINLAREFRRVGFHNALDSVKFILMRAPYRVLPNSLRRRMYIRFLRTGRRTSPGEII
jgi:glycosyltransferase involved in cell wall biosynthesis